MRRSVSEAFWALCAADSMSMPVHWYYNIDDIRTDFGGWISGFNSPQDRHPSSILTLSNTSRRTSGRFSETTRDHGSDARFCFAANSGRTAWSAATNRPDVVGNIILHDKLDLWKASTGSVHYHKGLTVTDTEL